MFELIQLRCFVAVAEELHFGRAAARLNMTQPPLSRHIQVLERIVGLELLARSSRSVRLTAAGVVFLAEARRIVELSDSAVATARAAAEGQRGMVALGFTAAPTTAAEFATTVDGTIARLAAVVQAAGIRGDGA